MKEIERIIQHLLRHKEFAKGVISKSYPFTKSELRKYSDKLDWELVSANENISWTESLFNEFGSKINFEDLRENESFPWTEEFIDRYIKELFYNNDPEYGEWKSDFGWNKGLPWSEKFIDKYIEHWDWQFLSMNDNLPFTIELIEKYSDKWRYDLLEYNFGIKATPELKSYLNIFHNCNIQEDIHNCKFCFKGEEIFEEYKGMPVSPEFIYCPNFNWSDDFASKLRTKIRGENDEKIVVDVLTTKAFNHWSIDVLDAFEEYWHYDTSNFPDELTDYLAFSIKDSTGFEELMKKLSI
jgi:hypothetical protein